MRKLILICLLVLPSYAMAQGVAANKAAVKPAPSIEEKKSPSIIVLPSDAVKPLNDIQMLRRVLELELENAKLKAANVELQLKSASDAFTKAFNEAYIKAGGQTGDGQYKWDVLPDGAWRVTKAVEEKPKTP